MSVASTTNKVQYTITGLPQVLTVNFVFDLDTDLLVLDGNTVLTNGSDYSLTTGGSGATGTITVVGTGFHAVQVGTVVTIMRNVPLTQLTSFDSTGVLTAAMIESGFDKLTEIDQQETEALGRSLHFEPNENLSGLMPLASRKGKFVSFDTNGNLVYGTPTVPAGPLIEFTSIASLRSFGVTGLVDGQTAYVAGYYAPGDGGGGAFVYNSASSATDNGGTVIQPASGSGRWLRVYSGAINVMWFGAYGDGSHDDTSAIRAAITALATKPGEIYFPVGSGAYLTSGNSTVITLSPGQVLCGDSYADASGHTSRINYSGTGTLISLNIECAIKNLNLNGPDHYPATTGSIGIQPVAPSDHWVIRDVKVNNFTSGLVLDTTWIGNIYNFYAAYCTSGVRVQNSQVQAINFFGGDIESCGKGAYITGAPFDGIHFSGVTFDGNNNYGVHVALANNATNMFGNLVIEKCYFEQNGTADASYDIYLDGAYLRAPIVRDNFFVNTHTCLAINASTYALVTGNSFRPGNGTAGTRKSINLLSGGCSEAFIGPNHYETNAFDPATDDSGGNTVIYSADLFSPPALSNGNFILARSSTGTSFQVLGIVAGKKYVLHGSGETVAGSEAHRFNDGSGNTIMSLLAGNGLQLGGMAGFGIFYGPYSPEGNVTANIGSLYLRTDDGADNYLYVKESGTGNTGWVGK